MWKTPVLLYFIVCKMYDKRNTNQNMLDEKKYKKSKQHWSVWTVIAILLCKGRCWNLNF